MPCLQAGFDLGFGIGRRAEGIGHRTECGRIGQSAWRIGHRTECGSGNAECGSGSGKAEGGKQSA